MDCPLHLVLRIPPTVEELEQMHRERLERIRQRQLAYEAEKRRGRDETRRLRSQVSAEQTQRSTVALLHAYFCCRVSNVMLFVAAVAPVLVILVLARAGL
jgi:hypothetical protein